MNFEIGQKVKLKPFRDCIENRFCIFPKMHPRFGNIVTISKLLFNHFNLGEVNRFKIEEDNNGYSYDINWIDPEFKYNEEVVLIKRNLAFYKKSGEPWTKAEYINIIKYVGDSCTTTNYNYSAKWCFDDGLQIDFMHTWDRQENHPNFKSCKQVAYEDIFNIKLTQKENKMATVKTISTTSAELLSTNKDNVKLVAQVTAGKAINTKVIKMIKPKVPVMLRGYLDTPMAAPIVSNVIAFAIKHYTDNTNAHAVADMMLQASAFQLADSLNIDLFLEELLDGIPDIEKLTSKSKTRSKSNAVNS